MLAALNRRSFTLLVTTCLVLLTTLLASTPAQSKVVKTETTAGTGLSTPVTQWRDSEVEPRAVALAIHGLVLHGGSYDVMARSLAAQGIVVIAPDLRGYGHWVSHERRHDSVQSPIDYRKSHADMVSLAGSIKSDYPGLKFFGIGESLGADMVLHLAAQKPDLLDGVVLSAPSVRHRWFVADILRKVPCVLSMPFKQIDVAPHIHKYFSNDIRVADAAVDDPLVRKRMSIVELWRTSNEANNCLKYAKDINADLPVLVMQGSDDQMLRSEAVADLFKVLPSSDSKLEWFEKSGHLLLETRYVQPKTMSVVSDWLNQHLKPTVAITPLLVTLKPEAGHN